MYPDQPDDFNDPFGEPIAGAAHGAGLDPIVLLWLLGIVAALCVIGLIAYGVGRMIARSRFSEDAARSAKNIYDHINYTLNKAVKAAGPVQIEYARELLSVVDQRLGSVLLLKERSGKFFDDLKKALAEPEVEEPEKDKGAPPPKVKVAMVADEYRVEVWKALQGFKAFWGDEAHILKLLTDAQKDVSGLKRVTPDFYRKYGLINPKDMFAVLSLPLHKPKTTTKPKVKDKVKIRKSTKGKAV